MHWLDRLSLRVLQRMHIFEGGWGDVEQFRARAAEGNQVRPARKLELTWGPTQRLRGLTVQDGVAESPSAELLPSTIATLRVRRILTPRPAKRRVVIPPSWGDGGYGPRMWLYGALVAQGLEPWLLEGAYLGARAAPMPRVEDFLRMGFAHIEEVRALVQTHHDAGVPTSVAGYSMAGQLGSHAVATLPFEVPVVAMAAPTSADVVFIEGPLAGQLRWEALGDGAKEKLREVFQHADLLKLEPPKSTKRAVALNAGDGIVAPGSTGKLAKHWGVEPLTLRTGHTGAYVFERRALQRFISDTLR